MAAFCRSRRSLTLLPPPRNCVQAEDNMKQLEQKLDMLAMAMGSKEKAFLQRTKLPVIKSPSKR